MFVAVVVSVKVDIEVVVVFVAQDASNIVDTIKMLK